MRTIVIISFFFTVIFGSQSHGVYEHSIDGKGINTVHVDGYNFPAIRVVCNGEAEDIQIKVFSNASPHNDIELDLNDEGDLKIQFRKEQQPISKDDIKVARKSQITQLVIILPSQLNLNIESEQSEVFISGQYDSLQTRLKFGSFEFSGWAKSADISTISADVEIRTNDIDLDAISENGT